MKKLIINISTLIKKGVLRIFPKSLHIFSQIFSWIFVRISSVAIPTKNAISKATYWSVFLLGFSFLILVGCSTSRHMATQLVHDVRIDTLYLTKQQYDSIFIFKDRSMDYHRGIPETLKPSETLKPDTLYIKDVSIEYRYKMLRDTVRIVERDSIPYEVTVIETKEITRPLTWFDHLTRLTFWFVIGSLLTWIYIHVIRKIRVH